MIIKLVLSPPPYLSVWPYCRLEWFPSITQKKKWSLPPACFPLSIQWKGGMPGKPAWLWSTSCECQCQSWCWDVVGLSPRGLLVPVPVPGDCPCASRVQVPLSGQGGSSWVWALAGSCPLGALGCNLAFCPFWCCGLLSVSWQFTAALQHIWAKLLHVSHFISALLQPFCFSSLFLSSVLTADSQVLLVQEHLLAGCCELQTIDKKFI